MAEACLRARSLADGPCPPAGNAGVPPASACPPDGGGLRIDPTVDPAWRSFALHRRFRGATYHIHFENPDGVESGVSRISLDGKQIAGTLLPLPRAAEHSVKVIMGEPPPQV